MSISGNVLVAGAGLIAGVFGTVTGIGSVFSYPVLLAMGLPATAANVTNTVSLAIGGLGGIYGSRPELSGQNRTLRRLAAVCVVGSVAGSALLLASPAGIFERVVPFLVAGGSALILLPRPQPHSSSPGQRPSRRAVLGMLGVATYNGYFAAAGGVLIIAVLLATSTQTLPRINALKNVLVVIVDAIAALTFAAFGPVSWAHVLPLTLGLAFGSWIGPAIARRLPPERLRIAIAVAGLGLAVTLGTDAFA